MMRLDHWKQICAVILFCATTATVSPAQVTLTTLVTFDGADGSTPDYMVLTQGADGNFYGTTYEGGASYGNGGPGYGSVFRVTPAGTLTTLYSFCPQAGCADGAYPSGSLVQTANGDFYGTTQEVGSYGYGTIFKITPAGKLTTLYSFCILANCADGKEPLGGLAQATNGNFYGTTSFGGVNGGGTVFAITPAGKATTLHNFCPLGSCADGDQPRGNLIQASDGDLYGETGLDGAYGYGTIFKISTGRNYNAVQLRLYRRRLP